MYPGGMSNAQPQVEVLEKRVRLWRMVSGALAIVAIFLGVVVAGQLGAASVAPVAAQTEESATSGTSTDEQATDQSVPDLARRVAGDPMALGAVDAPIVLIEWGDYRCPFCASFANDTLPTVIQEYVDAGLVRFEFNDVVFFGDDSAAAAVAGRAAGEQDRFHEYMSVLYAAAPESGHPDMGREKLVAFAETAGVPDLAKFEADLDSPELQQAVAASTAQAQQLGVTSVPFFLVGDQVMAGAQPLDTFRQVLDEQLAKVAG